MSTAASAVTSAVVHDHVKVTRRSKASLIGAAIAVPLLVLLAFLPYLVDRGTQQSLVLLFSLIVMGTMWNLLAGYGGMVSIGQQAFIGTGAYGLAVVADLFGVHPFLAVPVSVAVAGVVAWLSSFLVFRLAGGYFAIGTWVLAEVFKLVTVQIPQLGGGSGLTLRAYSGMGPGLRIASVYWLSLMAAVAAIAVTYGIMRTRLGLGFTAIRDDTVAASSLGVRVSISKRIVYVVSAMGCALAGAMIASSTLNVQPESIFNVQYSAFMLFIVVIGGIGTIGGPIIGAILFFALQQWLGDLGSWYLVVLGIIAIAVVLLLPQGLWGLISGNGRLRLFPVGYTLVDTKPRFLDLIRVDFPRHDNGDGTTNQEEKP